MNVVIQVRCLLGQELACRDTSKDNALGTSGKGRQIIAIVNLLVWDCGRCISMYTVFSVVEIVMADRCQRQIIVAYCDVVIQDTSESCVACSKTVLIYAVKE
jgi:hypothetical protein